MDISDDGEQIVVAQDFANRRDCGAKLSGLTGPPSLERSTCLDPLTFLINQTPREKSRHGVTPKGLVPRLWTPEPIKSLYPSPAKP